MLKKRRTPHDDVSIAASEPVYTSGVVSRLLGIPVWVLKQLDRENVVRPPRRQRCSRLYSSAELKKLQYVWYYMSIKKVNVEGVKEILERDADAEKGR